MNKPEEINPKVWWNNGGGMLYRRDCLPPDHPEYLYNYVKREFNVNPEDYGIIHPFHKKDQVNRIKLILKAKGVTLTDENIEEILNEFNAYDESDPDEEANYTY